MTPCLRLLLKGLNALLQESLRRYTVVPIVSRQLAAEDELCGHVLPAGCTIICSMKSVHQYWSKPDLWQPERFMPGGEFDSFEEGIRPYMVSSCASGLPSSTLLANSLSLVALPAVHALHSRAPKLFGAELCPAGG